ncbi:MAG: mannose-6-phosphate isomerase, partial [Terracidiphilus sp.]
MTRQSNYDKFPSIEAGDERDCAKGWTEIGSALVSRLPERGGVISVECYPGTFVGEIERGLCNALMPDAIIRTWELFKNPEEIHAMLSPFLGTDPVFGRMNGITIG